MPVRLDLSAGASEFGQLLSAGARSEFVPDIADLAADLAQTITNNTINSPLVEKSPDSIQCRLRPLSALGLLRAPADAVGAAS